MASHAVNDVVARFTMKFVIQSHIVGCTEFVFVVLNRARNDLLRSVSVIGKLRITGAISDTVDPHDAEDVAVVAQNHVRIAGMAV